MTYALIGPAGTIVTERDDIDPRDAHTKSGYRWLPIVIDRADFNPLTQFRSGPFDTIGAKQVTRAWTVRDKTAQELSDEAEATKERQIDEAGQVAFRVLFNHENRIRALEGKQAVTPEQFRAALKAML